MSVPLALSLSLSLSSLSLSSLSLSTPAFDVERAFGRESYGALLHEGMKGVFVLMFGPASLCVCTPMGARTDGQSVHLFLPPHTKRVFLRDTLCSLRGRT